MQTNGAILIAFTRNIPRNLMDEAEIAGKLSGITSKKRNYRVVLRRQPATGNQAYQTKKKTSE